jgi:hypothetical protein
VHRLCFSTLVRSNIIYVRDDGETSLIIRSVESFNADRSVVTEVNDVVVAILIKIEFGKDGILPLIGLRTVVDVLEGVERVYYLLVE